MFPARTRAGAFALLACLALSPAASNAGDHPFGSWRAAGARPVLAAILEDGGIDEAERGIVRTLSGAIGETVTVTIPGHGETTVAPQENDARLLSVMQSEGITFHELWKKDLRVFTQLAMLTDATWKRQRRYAASRFYEFAKQAEHSGMSLRERLEDWYRFSNATMRAFMSDVEEAALARLSFEAMQMVAGLDEADLPPDSYEWLKCEFKDGAAC